MRPGHYQTLQTEANDGQGAAGAGEKGVPGMGVTAGQHMEV